MSDTDTWVHNHGPDEGLGLDCPQRIVDGQLKGACLRAGALKLQPHGEIKIRDYNGYSIYYCADCGQDINSPGCSAKVSTQPNPPTFDSLLNDPTQQLDVERGVARSILAPVTRGGAHE